MMCTGQMIDLQMDERNQGHHVISVTNFPQPNMHSMLSAPGNSSNFDVRHLPEHYDGSAMFYGIGQYNGVQHHHPVPSLDIGVAPGSNIYNPYLTPSSGNRGFPVSINHGPSDQLPSSSNHGVIGVSTDEYGRENHFMDGVRGACKRKNAEGILGNFQYINGLASSSSSVPPFNTRHLESGVSMMDSASFAQPQYRGNNAPSIMEVGSHRSVRNRSGAVGLDSVLAHNHNHLVQGNYIGHPFQPSGNPWVDQQSGNNGSDGGTLAWNHGPALPYLHGILSSHIFVSHFRFLNGSHLMTKSSFISTHWLYGQPAGCRNISNRDFLNHVMYVSDMSVLASSPCVWYLSLLPWCRTTQGWLPTIKLVG